jgi:hypothetical protein
MTNGLPTKELLCALERERTRALVERDLAAVERLHAPEYQLVTPSGRTFDLTRYLAALAAQPFYTRWEMGDEVDVRLSAGMALLRYRAMLSFPSGRTVTCWHTDAYEWRGDRWLAVWSQATEIAPPDAGGAARPLQILVAGPYRSGTGDDPVLIAKNVAAMTEISLQLFHAGHLPVMGEWYALPLIEHAGGQHGDAVFDAIFHPVARRLVARCDGCLRIGGPSAGADEMVALARRHGKAVYNALAEVPAAG